jgi:hypothetical protein|tara:strand:+ start:1324 stop:1974 length:651 start_codon:yes stop_codon:yes gene_type:complete
MANSNGSFGLRPIGIVGQGANTTGATEYRIKSNNNTKLYQGNPCIPTADGTVIAAAAAGGAVGLVGVFWGCEYVRLTDGKTIWSNSWQGTSAGVDTNFPIKAFVYDNPMQTFTIATSSTVGSNFDTEALLRAAVFLNANFAAANAGNDTTGISTGTLNVTTIAATAALHLRVIGIQDDPDNSDFTVAGIPVIVRLNNSFNSANGALVSGTPSTTGV